MKNPDILLAIKPVVNAFNRLPLPYYITLKRHAKACGISVLEI